MATQGWYFDGQTSARHAVTISLLPDRLDIHGIDTPDIKLAWPLKQLWWAQSPNADGKARLALQGDNAARLELEDPALIAAIRGSCPDIDKAGKDKGGRRKLVIILATTFVSVGLAIFAAAAILPNLLAPMMPASISQAMGKAAVEQVIDLVGALEKNPVKRCTAKSGHAAMTRFRDRLAAATDYSGPLKITVVNAKMINALAAPGGRLVVFKGFIEFANNPEEFAAVMAHELGHVIHRHPTKSMIRHIGLTGTLDLLLAGGGQGLLGTATGLMLRTAYSRDAEREADDAALHILKSANIKTTGLISVFRRFSKELPGLPDSLKLFSTHPLSTERAARLSKQVSESGTAAMPPADWKLIQEMCGPTKKEPK